MRKAYYEASFQDFCAENESAILGELTTHHQHDLEHLQRNAWITQVKYLQAELANFPDGHIFFEFVIPRMGKRVDCLVLLNGVVFVVEFKVGSSSFDRHAIEQVVDYSLDLKNFHEGCHDPISTLFRRWISNAREKRIPKPDFPMCIGPATLSSSSITSMFCSGALVAIRTGMMVASWHPSWKFFRSRE